MGRPLEILGYIMAGHVEKNRRIVAKLRNLLWDGMDRHKERPDTIDTLSQFGRLLDDLDYTAANQWDILKSNGLSDSDLANTLRQLADDLDNGG